MRRRSRTFFFTVRLTRSRGSKCVMLCLVVLSPLHGCSARNPSHTFSSSFRPRRGSQTYLVISLSRHMPSSLVLLFLLVCPFSPLFLSSLPFFSVGSSHYPYPYHIFLA